jgi:hypothetical protein
LEPNANQISTAVDHWLMVWFQPKRNHPCGRTIRHTP